MDIGHRKIGKDMIKMDKNKTMTREDAVKISREFLEEYGLLAECNLEILDYEKHILLYPPGIRYKHTNVGDIWLVMYTGEFEEENDDGANSITVIISVDTRKVFDVWNHRGESSMNLIVHPRNRDERSTKEKLIESINNGIEHKILEAVEELWIDLLNANSLDWDRKDAEDLEEMVKLCFNYIIEEHESPDIYEFLKVIVNAQEIEMVKDIDTDYFAKKIYTLTDEDELELYIEILGNSLSHSYLPTLYSFKTHHSQEIKNTALEVIDKIDRSYIG